MSKVINLAEERVKRAHTRGRLGRLEDRVQRLEALDLAAFEEAARTEVKDLMCALLLVEARLHGVMSLLAGKSLVPWPEMRLAETLSIDKLPAEIRERIRELSGKAWL